MTTDIFAHELKRTPQGASLFMLADEVDAEMQDPWMDQISDNRTGFTNREELVSLRSDLALIEEGWVPQRDDLMRYPALEDWGITKLEGEPLCRLYGRGYGFSGFADGLEIVMMQLLAVDHCFRWARDRAHIYRLGRRRPDADVIRPMKSHVNTPIRRRRNNLRPATARHVRLCTSDRSWS